MLNGVSERYKEKTRLVLKSLAYAIRPLRQYELSVIANLPEPSDVLRIYTSCLVRMVPMPGKSSRMNKIEERASRDTGPFFSQGISTIRHLDTTKTRRGFILPRSSTFSTSQLNQSLVGYLLENKRLHSQGESLDNVLTYTSCWYRHVQEADTAEAVENLRAGV